MKSVRQHRPLRSAMLAVWIGVNLFMAMLTVLSAYGGKFDPDERVIASIVAMVLPGLLIIGAAVAVIDLIFVRRLALVIVASWAISLPSILVFSPLNGWKRPLTSEQRKDSFTFLTYNVFHFSDFRGNDQPDVESNATLDNILSANADIVSLQESGPINVNKNRKITQGQIDSLNERYPYSYSSLPSYTVYSKYPMEEIKLDLDSLNQESMCAFRIDIHGRKVTLLDVHLESFRLTDEDKELYKEALDIPRTQKELKREMKEVKSQLLSKLAATFKQQAIQARKVRCVVDSIGGPIIVAGDFNNIPDSYPVRTIRGGDMHDAYADTGFGPTITYHANMFYFRIDQVLYRGPFKAVDIQRGSVKSSDHYPLLTTFLFDDL